MKKVSLAMLLCAATVAGCSDPEEGADVVSGSMAEGDVTAVERLPEGHPDVGVRTDLGDDADPEGGLDVLPEKMTERSLSSVETVQENKFDVDVRTVDVGRDAVAVR